MELEIGKRSGAATANSVGVEIWDREKSMNAGLSHRSVVVIGRDLGNQPVGFVPVKFSAQEIEGYDNRDGEVRAKYRAEIDPQILAAGKKAFGLEE